MMDPVDDLIVNGQYVTPGVSDLRTVTESTLGTAGLDQPDDTQYFED
ncbi:hypothetical protein ABZY45_19625 [Streptomyces sp. NPDC006516]